MSGGSARGYALRAATLALGSGALAAAILWPLGASRAWWLLASWGALSTIGIGGGVALVLRHGSAGPGFVLAMGSAMILRSIAALGLLVGALRAGGGATAACLAGLIAGFVPQQVFEVLWFGRGRGLHEGRREPTGEA